MKDADLIRKHVLLDLFIIMSYDIEKVTYLLL